MKIVSSLWLIIPATISVMLACKPKTSTPLPVATAITDSATVAVLPDSQPKLADITFQEYKASRTRLWDLIHTRIEISFNWEKRQAIAEATLKLKPYFYPQDTLKLDAVGFDISEITQVIGQKETPLKFSYDSTVITIPLNKMWKRNEEITIAISYVANPERNADGGGSAITSEKGLFFINHDGKDTTKPQQIWTQGETQFNSRWFPTIDSPNEKSTQEMLITVDSAYTTLSNGTLMYSTYNKKNKTRTDVWEMKQPHATYLFMMAVGKFAVVKDTWRKKEVNYYVEPEYAADARAIFGRTPAMLEFFSKRFGVDYPWSKYSQVIVREYVSGAMENTSASIFMEAVQKKSRYFEDETWDDIVSHELAHHWFGDLVTAESWGMLPLNESFANYSEYLWRESANGRDDADLHIYEAFGQYLSGADENLQPLIRHKFNQPDQMFDLHSYNKGGSVLHFIRKQLGDEAFFEGLKLYLTRHAYTSVDVDALRIALEETSGTDLQYLFTTLFEQKSYPKLQCITNWENGTLTLQVSQDVFEDNLPYSLKMNLEVYTAGGKVTTFPYHVTQLENVYTFKTDKPECIILDADFAMPGVARREIKETKAEIIARLKYAKLGIYRYRALEQLAALELEESEIDEIVKVGLSDKFHAVRQGTLELLATKLDSAKTEIKFGNQIRGLVASDLKNTVRGTALELLAINPTLEANKDLFKKHINARSYSMQAASAEGLLAGTTGAEAEKVIAQIEAEKENPKTGQILASYYIKNKVAGKYGAIEKLAKKATGGEAFRIFEQLALYIMDQPDYVQTQAKEFFIKSCKAPDFGVKLGAFRALVFLSGENEDPKLKEVIKEVYETETNKDIQNYMRMMMR